MESFNDYAGIHQTMETPAISISQRAAHLSYASAIAFLVLLAGLHFIKPEFDPSWRFVSEYAIGDYGWVMKMAFFFVALSCISVVVAIRFQVQTGAGKIGLVLLLIVAAALIMAGIFVMDPITAGKDELTVHGSLHGIASMIGIPGFPIAALLIRKSLIRSNAVRFAARNEILWTTHLIWICLLVMFAVVFISLGRTQGKFGPDVLIGWPNRLLVISYSLWLMAIAKNAIRMAKEKISII